MPIAHTVRQRRGYEHLPAVHKRNRRAARPIAYFLLAGIIGLVMVSSTRANDLNFALFPSRCKEHRIWRPYTDLSFRGGDNGEMGEADLFVPLVQDSTQLLFADVRGKFFDDSSSEGNWGLAYRQIRPSEWIIGGYAFYDVRESAVGNTWHQGVFGAELMNVDWDFRMNGYLAEGGAQATGASPAAFLSGGTIVVVNSLERSYSGFDGEIGRLLWASCDRFDIEVRGYVGAFHFDTDAAGFPNVSGPRARLEMRSYDLNFLGTDSRLTLGYEYQYDDVRGSQNTAFLAVRIPFGRGGGRNGRRLTPLERRMVEPIVRDVDIVTQGGSSIETAQINGVDIDNANQVNGGSDLGAAVVAGGNNSVVIATGNFTPGGPITLNQNQTLLGGGSSLQVTTASGLKATYTAPGTRPTISGVVDEDNDTADRVLVLAENSTVSGVDIDAGEVGVYANAVNGITIVDNNISNMTDDDTPDPIAGHAIHLNDNASGTITGNTLHKNQGDSLHLTGTSGAGIGGKGINIDSVGGLTISGNTLSSDGVDGLRGIYLENFAGGTISGNVIRGYNLNLGVVTDDAYVNIESMSGGTISNNIIENNAFTADGSVFALRIGTLTGGTITNNTVRGNSVVVTNGNVAAFYVDTMTGGAVSNNTVNTNTVSTDNGRVAAMYVDDMQGGAVSGNTANGNTLSGNQVSIFGAWNMGGGTITGNTANGNEVNGTAVGAGVAIFGTFSGGTISNNTASNNTNTSGVAPDGFYVNIFNGTAQLNNNTATNNSGNGYDVVNPSAGATATGNTGSGNTGGNNTYTYPP